MGWNVETVTPDQTVRKQLEDTLGLTTPLNMNIHEHDQMFTFITSARGSEAVARSEYFTSGVQLLKVFEQIVEWKFGSFDNVSSLLDFASGYGRLTRFLVHKLPASHIWVSDIQADAVAFQQAEFGVHGFISTTDPADLECDQTFDCIFVASLFSHLPGATFAKWLKKLYSLLKPGGLLAFSLNDESRLPKGQTMPESGIWFGEGSEVGTLDTKEYGTTIVSEAFVSQTIAGATGHPDYMRIPYGFQYHQDLYLVVNEPKPDFSSLHFTYYPHGTVEYGLRRANGTFHLVGWAGHIAEDRSSVEVQIFVKGQLRQKCTPSIPRPDVQEHYQDDRFLYTGWECSFALPNEGANQIILVKGVSSTRDESLLYVGSIASLAPRGGVDSCLRTGSGELHIAGWAVDVVGDHSPVEVQIFVEGQLRQKCLPSIKRSDLQELYKDDRFLYCGWECSLHLPDDNSTQMMEVRTLSSTGDESLLYVGSIAFLQQHRANNDNRTRATPQSTQPDLNHELKQVRDLEADLDQRLKYIRHLEAEIVRKNTAIADLETRLRRRLLKRLLPGRQETPNKTPS